MSCKKYIFRFSFLIVVIIIIPVSSYPCPGIIIFFPMRSFITFSIHSITAFFF